MYISTEIGRNFLKLAGISRNWSEFDPRWNEGYYCTGLHVGMRYFGYSGWNRTKLLTLVISKANHN